MPQTCHCMRASPAPRKAQMGIFLFWHGCVEWSIIRKPMFMLDCPLTEEPHRVSSSWALHWNTSYKMKIGGSVRTHAPEETNRATAALSQACSGNLETDPEHAREWLILDVDTPLLWIIRPDGHQTYSAQCLTGPPRGCSKKSKNGPVAPGTFSQST